MQTFIDLLSNAVTIGLRNAAPLFFAVLLWILTLWIPYINVGTTIGLFAVTAQMARDTAISPLEIFHARYRKQMGEFLLVIGFIVTGSLSAAVFMAIPGYIVYLTWSLAPLLVVDMNTNPVQALQDSNDRTYGYKWPIFFAGIVLQIGLFIVNLISTGIIGVLANVLGDSWVVTGLGLLTMALVWALSVAISFSLQAAVYRQLVLNKPSE